MSLGIHRLPETTTVGNTLGSYNDNINSNNTTIINIGDQLNGSMRGPRPMGHSPKFAGGPHGHHGGCHKGPDKVAQRINAFGNLFGGLFGGLGNMFSGMNPLSGATIAGNNFGIGSIDKLGILSAMA